LLDSASAGCLENIGADRAWNASSALNYFPDERDGLMDSIDDRLASVGLQLPDEPLTPGGSYVPFVRSGNQLLVAGQICRVGEEVQFTGVIGDGLTVEEGQAAARLCALNSLAVAMTACGGDFSRLRLLSLSGFIRCVPQFGQQAKVMDGASDVFLQALGDNGKHVRTAVGVNALPRQAPVENSTVFEVINNND